MLIGKGITKNINDIKILDNIDIEVKKGHITTIIGPSGSGKSTLLSCLSLLINPNKGKITVDNKEFTFNTGEEKYSNYPYPYVSVVFQGLFLWPHLTNRENLLLPLKEKGDDEQNFEYLSRLLNIDSILDKYPNESSVGERQRVALTRQILLKPGFLLLDEITSALDIEQVKIVGDLLLELKKRNTGILLITHMINFAKSISDFVYFLDKGSLIEKGDVNILVSPTTDRLNRFLQIYT